MENAIDAYQEQGQAGKGCYFMHDTTDMIMSHARLRFPHFENPSTCIIVQVYRTSKVSKVGN